MKDPHIDMLHQFRSRIQEIRKEEMNAYKPPVNLKRFIRIIEEHETDNPFQPKKISERTKRKCRGGVLCGSCGAFNVETNKPYVTCVCGTREPRENAILRTICEYGVINYEKDLKTTDLYLFFNKQYSKVTLRKYLKKHFTKKGRFKSTRFINKKSKFNSLLPVFALKQKQLHVFKDYT